jgi:hypothetical protein
MVSGRMRAEGGVAVAVQRIEQWAA